MNKLRRLLLICIAVIAVCLVPTLAQAQQSYPGTALFSYGCVSSGIQFYYLQSPVIQVTIAQLSSPLSMAIALRQNQPVATSSGVGLWALQSNELQIHLNADPDGTKLVLPSSVCGAVPISATPTTNGGGTVAQAVAYAQAANGGQAFAFAGVNAAGQAFAFAGATGNGAQAGAFAQSGGNSGGSGGTYVVQTGDNLFRIALRFGTTVEVLASINGIADPRLIYVGQVIRLP